MSHTAGEALLEKYLDGLDAAVDGRGLGEDHHAAYKEVMRRLVAFEPSGLVARALEILGMVAAGNTEIAILEGLAGGLVDEYNQAKGGE